MSARTLGAGRGTAVAGLGGLRADRAQSPADNKPPCTQVSPFVAPGQCRHSDTASTLRDHVVTLSVDNVEQGAAGQRSGAPAVGTGAASGGSAPEGQVSSRCAVGKHWNQGAVKSAQTLPECAPALRRARDRDGSVCARTSIADEDGRTCARDVDQCDECSSCPNEREGASEPQRLSERPEQVPSVDAAEAGSACVAVDASGNQSVTAAADSADKALAIALAAEALALRRTPLPTPVQAAGMVESVVAGGAPAAPVSCAGAASADEERTNGPQRKPASKGAWVGEEGEQVMDQGGRRAGHGRQASAYWTRDEDEQVRELVGRIGVGSKLRWSVLASHMPGRSGKQVRERWLNHLNPNVKKDRWTPEEDDLLIEAQARLENKWAEIARLLPGRSENAIKNRWHFKLSKPAHQHVLAPTDAHGENGYTADDDDAQASPSTTSLGPCLARLPTAEGPDVRGLGREGPAEASSDGPVWKSPNARWRDGGAWLEGRKIAVYYDGEQQWFAGKVLSFDRSADAQDSHGHVGPVHEVIYDDGVFLENLAAASWRFDATEGVPDRPCASAGCCAPVLSSEAGSICQACMQAKRLLRSKIHSRGAGAGSARDESRGSFASRSDAGHSYAVRIREPPRADCEACRGKHRAHTCGRTLSAASQQPQPEGDGVTGQSTTESGGQAKEMMLQKVSRLDAVARVLRAAGKMLHYNQIAREVLGIHRGCSESAGRAGEGQHKRSEDSARQSLKALLYKTARKKGRRHHRQHTIVHMGNGVFGLPMFSVKWCRFAVEVHPEKDCVLVGCNCGLAILDMRLPMFGLKEWDCVGASAPFSSSCGMHVMRPRYDADAWSIVNTNDLTSAGSGDAHVSGKARAETTSQPRGLVLTLRRSYPSEHWDTADMPVGLEVRDEGAASEAGAESTGHADGAWAGAVPNKSLSSWCRPPQPCAAALGPPAEGTQVGKEVPEFINPDDYEDSEENEVQKETPRMPHRRERKRGPELLVALTIPPMAASRCRSRKAWASHGVVEADDGRVGLRRRDVIERRPEKRRAIQGKTKLAQMTAARTVGSSDRPVHVSSGTPGRKAPTASVPSKRPDPLTLSKRTRPVTKRLNLFKSHPTTRRLGRGGPSLAASNRAKPVTNRLTCGRSGHPLTWPKRSQVLDPQRRDRRGQDPDGSAQHDGSSKPTAKQAKADRMSKRSRSAFCSRPTEAVVKTNVTRIGRAEGEPAGSRVDSDAKPGSEEETVTETERERRSRRRTGTAAATAESQGREESSPYPLTLRQQSKKRKPKRLFTHTKSQKVRLVGGEPPEEWAEMKEESAESGLATVGSRVSLYWLLDQGRGKWFPGEIAKCCIKGGTRRDGLVSNRWHLIEYDDGDEAWCDLKVFMQQGHLRWKRGGAGWGERAYCETCDLHFESEAALTAHQAKRHCELTEDTAAPAPGHVSEGRDGGLSHGMDGVFYCELCDMHFKNAAALYGHSSSKKHRALTHRQGKDAAQSRPTFRVHRDLDAGPVGADGLATRAVTTVLGPYIVGWRVSLYWEHDDDWFSGTVTRCQPCQQRCSWTQQGARYRFFVEYDDGDSEWY